MEQAFLNVDLVDQYGDAVASCETQFRQFGRRRRFFGRIRTVRCIADNVLLRRVLETPGHGCVLVVDGGGYLGCAILGDLIAGIARDNGWAGLIIYGAIRDSVAIDAMEVGVKALGTNPRKSGKHGVGQVDVPVGFGGVSFLPGQWVYSDEDGILVAAEALPLGSDTLA